MNKEKIRCFIGIKFPNEIVEEVKKVQRELEKKNLFYGKFTEPENLHLTLKFLGEISEDEVRKVRERLKGVAENFLIDNNSGFVEASGEEKITNSKPNSIQATLGKLGVFSEKFIRIVWIEVLGEKIFELQKKIDESLKDLFKPEERFMSHLTIARVKKVKDRELFLEELKKIRVCDLKFNVDCFYLMRSELKSTGAEYFVIEKYELK